jgi:aminoglycoside phosphotransferase family enzyme
MAWFIATILFFSNLLFILLSIYVTYKAYHWARIVMIVEDDLSDAIQTLNDTEETMNKLLSMQLFIDSPEVKMMVEASLSEVKMAKFEVNKVTQKFVQKSKQKYVIETMENEEIPSTEEENVNLERYRLNENQKKQ